MSGRKLPLFNRKPERAKFQKVLRGQIGVRGLVLHSHGDRGWGKSDLLRLFLHECEACESPMTLGLLFDPSDSSDRVANWKLILDRTAAALGHQHFSHYLSASTTARSKQAQEGEGGYSGVSGQVGLIASDVRQQTGDIAGVMIKQSFYGAERSEEFQTDITEIFFEELEAIAEHIQVVWLVDSLDWIGPETAIWLRKVFGRIAKRRATRVILVVAGREMLTYPTSWQGKIEEMDVRPFNMADVLELFSQIGWGGDRQVCELAAERLIDRCGGRPLEVCTEISRLWSGGEA